MGTFFRAEYCRFAFGMDTVHRIFFFSGDQPACLGAKCKGRDSEYLEAIQ